MRITRHIVFVLSIVFITIILTKSAGAQSPAEKENYNPSLTISPSVLDLDVRPGQNASEKITVRNNTQSPLPVTVQVLNYETDEYGYPSYSDDVTLTRSPIGWITPDPADMIIEADSVHDVSIDISIPQEARSGSHLGTIMFKPVLPPDYFTPHSAHVIPYIGAIISLNVRTGNEEPPEEYLHIDEFSAQDDAEEKVEKVYAARVRNEDVYYHRVSGSINVFSIFNNLVLTKNVDSTTLLPERASYITGTLAEELSFGKYRAEFTIEEDDALDTETVEFWVKPTILEIIQMGFILISMIAIIGTGYLLIWKRENVKKSLGILLKNRA